MFRARTPMRLEGCNGKRRKDAEGNSTRVVVLTFMLQPFTAEMADDLNVKGRLFSLGDGQPLPEIKSANLVIAMPRQRMTLYDAPDAEMPVSVEVVAADVAPILRVRADKEGPVYAASFNVEFAFPSAKDLLWLFHKVTEQIFVTLEAEQSDLLQQGGQAESGAHAAPSLIQ